MIFCIENNQYGMGTSIARHSCNNDYYTMGNVIPGLKIVWKSQFYGTFVLNLRVVLHAIDVPPARWRGDAGSSSPPDALVDFHTG
jgi:hypothetical protein